MPVFSRFDQEEPVCFRDAAAARCYKKGKILYLQEEPADFMYVVFSGWVKLFYTMPEGNEIIIDMLTAGNMLGENALFKKDRHMYSAQVVEDAQLLSVSAAMLKDMVQINPGMTINILSSISRQHRRHHGALAFNAVLTAPQRVGFFLLKFCPKDKKTDIVFQLPYDKSLIASTLGIDRATFSRALRILRQKADICIDGPYVNIRSLEKLSEFVCGS